MLTRSPDPDRPWADNPYYGGMSDEAAERSWRARERQREQEEALKEISATQKLAGSTAACAVEAVTEDSAALKFRDRYDGQLLFDHDVNAWFVWDGCRWRSDRTGLAFEHARQLIRELTEKHSGRSKLLANRTGFASGVEKFATSDRAFAVIASEWDQDLFLLGTPEGTVNLRDGTLRPASPESRITKLTAVSPAATADCPIWLNFLNEATGSDKQLIRFLQQMCGYQYRERHYVRLCLDRSDEHVHGVSVRCASNRTGAAQRGPTGDSQRNGDRECVGRSKNKGINRRRPDRGSLHEA
jgi:hypothetical protein